MYIVQMAIPVPTSRREQYLEWAENSARILFSYGCLEIEEIWGDYIPRGKKTDFYRAVAAEDNEEIVIQRQVWSSKEALFEAEKKMHEEKALDVEGDVPFNAERIIVGCFTPFFAARSEANP